MATAGIAFSLRKPLYQSDAKLMVRYVVGRSGLDRVDMKRGVAITGSNDDSVIDTEIEILTSWDLAMEVAEVIAVEKNTKLTSDELASAASKILNNLHVTASKGSNVITLSYKCEDREVPTRVLQELMKRYYDKHLQVHRSVGGFDFDQEIDKVRVRLKETESALKDLNGKVGIVSLTENSAGVVAALYRSEQELARAEAEFTDQKIVVDALQSGTTGPALASTGSEDGKSRLATEVATLKVLQAKAQERRRLFDRYRSAANELAEVTPQIRELERKREVEEARYRDFEGKLEQARIDEKLALDSSKMPNISVIQRPTPAFLCKGGKMF